MPIARVQLEDGRIAKLEVPEGISEAEILDFAANLKPEVEPNYGEAALSMVNGIVAEPVAGLAGIASSMAIFTPEGSGADMVEKTRDNLTFDRSEGADQALKNIGEYIAPALEYLRMPASGIMGLGEVITGQGLEQASDTIGDTKKKGIGEVLGDRVMEETGNPELATLARTSPDVALAFLGFGASKKALKSLPQSAKKKAIGEKIKAGSADSDTARFQLTETSKPSTDFAGNPVVNFAEKSEVGPLKKPKISKDKQAIRAIDQGFTEGSVAAIKASSKTDRQKMLSMVNKMERGKKNELFAMKNRPSDVAGDSLMSRFRVVRKKNQKAAKMLDSEAKKLRGQGVDFDPVVDSFIAKLDDMGVKIDDNLSLNFKGSDIEKVKGAEGAIRNIVARMRDTKVPDGYDVHRLKKFIDEQVTYGKNAKGLSGKTEGVLKSLRHELDELLDTRFPSYDRVNTDYAQTRGAIDALQDAAGKIDLYGPNADKATGTLVRRLMSNAQSRIQLSDAIDEIDSIASQYRKFDDSIDSQMLFVNALDKRFGPVAETSFQGQIIQGGKQVVNAAADPTGKGLGDVVIDVASKGYDKVKGVTDEKAYAAIKDLLNR